VQQQIRERLRDTGVRILDVEALWLMPHVDVAGLLPLSTSPPNSERATC
jgi:hypothetical protein